MADYDSKPMGRYGERSGERSTERSDQEPDQHAEDPTPPTSESGEGQHQNQSNTPVSNQDFNPLHQQAHSHGGYQPDVKPEDQLIISPQAQQSYVPQTFTPSTFCNYCGSKLNAFFYFCTSCGTPYKDVNTVLSADIPRQLTEGELIRMKAPNVWPLFWTYVGVLIVGGVIGGILYLDGEPMWGMIIQMGALFVTTCVFSVMYWPSLAAQFKKPGFIHPAAWIGLGILVPMLLVNYGFSSMIEHLAEDLEGFDAMDQFFEEFSMGFLVVAICVFPAIVEEIAFRGLIQHWLMAAIKPWRAMILASFLFAIMHANVLSLPYLFGVGMLLGWTKWKTGSLYPAMLIHFLHNLVVITMFE